MVIMKLYPNAFDSILSGKKTIEMRLYDEKRRKLSIGEKIRFQESTSKREIIVRIISLHIFRNFDDLYKFFPKTILGYKEEEEALPSDMEEYYSLQGINKYGVVGIGIEVISNSL